MFYFFKCLTESRLFGYPYEADELHVARKPASVVLSAYSKMAEHPQIICMAEGHLNVGNPASIEERRHHSSKFYTSAMTDPNI